MGAYRLTIFLFRLIILCFATYLGRIITGSLLIIGGLIYGMTSHAVTYQHAQQKQFEIFILSDGTNYIKFDEGHFYIIDTVQFTPYPDENTFKNSRQFTSIIYASDSENINVQLEDGTVLSGTGYRVVQFALADSKGQTAQSFTTDDYNQHPTGFYSNHWLEGGIAAGAGVLLLCLSLLIPLLIKRRREQKEADATPVLAMQTPYTIPEGNNPGELSQSAYRSPSDLNNLT